MGYNGFMITMLTGDNSFEIERALDKLIADFDGKAEKIDGSELQLSGLPDLLMGVSLFSFARMIVIRNLSQNKSIWNNFSAWLSKVSDDIHLILIEPKPDKRTATYKSLKDKATIKEFLPLSDRDFMKAEKWVSDEARKLAIDMDKKCTQFLVQRVGVDQWRLMSALEKLALTDTISIETIEEIIEANPIENVFNLFEVAIKGNVDELRHMIRNLEQSQDPFALFALLSAQAFQLAAVANAHKSDDVAKDFGIHPFVVSKLSPIAKRLGKSGVSKIVKIFASADEDIKTTAIDHWLIIERALMKITSV